MHVFGFAVVQERTVADGHRRAGGQHGIAEDKRSVFQIGAGNVIHLDLERARFIVFAVGRDKGVSGTVKKRKEAFVQRQSGTQDARHHGVFDRQVHRLFAQGGLHRLQLIIHLLADFVGENLAYPAQVLAKTHGIALNFPVAEFRHETQKPRIAFLQKFYFHNSKQITQM